MERRRSTVAERRSYRVTDVESARAVAREWLRRTAMDERVTFGLPEVDDRYHVWRVPLLSDGSSDRVGEVVVDAYAANVDEAMSTNALSPGARSQEQPTESDPCAGSQTVPLFRRPLPNAVIRGDSASTLRTLPAESVDLVFTSPPYFNARPEYTDYPTYDGYLSAIRAVLREAHRVLSEGRFFVMNVAPVLVRRTSRSKASRRIAVPFDVHRLFIEEGYDFIDDIVWEKPEGAGWATGRGRRFSADRNPLQYKPVPVTEYVLVYRKHTDKLIDWNIRSHPDQERVRASRIGDDYERTNVWRIKPAHDRRHPAVFPDALAERVIAYYSFAGDLVLDPFAGIGTVGKAAAKLGRRFALIERNADYVRVMRDEVGGWLHDGAEDLVVVDRSTNTP